MDKRKKDRYLARITANSVEDGDCLIWCGRTDRNGYAVIDVMLTTTKQKELFVSFFMYCAFYELPKDKKT